LPSAYNLLRDRPWYRREAFSRGLRAAGYAVRECNPVSVSVGDVLLIWNRYGTWEAEARRFEQAGGTVLVAENGYIGRGGTVPKFAVHTAQGPRPDDYYALGLGHHNDDRAWVAGGPERWPLLGLEIKPWRTEGRHVLILPNRPFGERGRAMPDGWAEKAASRIRGETDREVMVRAHPGNDAPKRPLSADLEGAWAAVVWSSSAGVHALLSGIPVFCAGPYWSMKSAASTGTVEDPTLPDRARAFHRLSWGQWTCAEIESGRPFARLLSAAREGEVA
jgi:hypothetical protein